MLQIDSVEMKGMISAVRKHAEAHYDEGWDTLVECFDDKDIYKHIMNYGAKTDEKAIDCFRDLVSVWQDRQADAKNSAF